jgi:hypothetical protein
MATVAAKFKAVKFVKMIASQCIHNYPDSKTPTVIIYKAGNLIHNEVGLAAYGGMKMSALCTLLLPSLSCLSPLPHLKLTPLSALTALEWALSTWGALKSELQENPLLAKPANSVNITRFVGCVDCSHCLLFCRPLTCLVPLW